MGSVGDVYDYALCESFLATLKCELLGRRRFSYRAEAELAIFDYLEAGTSRAAGLRLSVADRVCEARLGAGVTAKALHDPQLQ